jgi:glycosyltransferase involved in cell wall biosynthesis
MHSGVAQRIAIVAPQPANGEIGGAERFFLGLRDSLAGEGVTAEIVHVPSDESDFQAIESGYLRFYDLNLGEFDGVISSKSPAYLVRHPNHICCLQHTMRVFYDMFDLEYPRKSPELIRQRNLIHTLDTAALKPPHTRRLFAIGEEVAHRLRMFNGLEAEVLHHPTTLAGLQGGEFRHLLLPGRLHRWKRVDLAIEAMRHVSAPIELIITGVGEDAEQFRQLASRDRRIRFLGRVPDSELAALYCNALAVLFVPRHEDLGLITLEAFSCGKPVITCTDSGEPARLVEDGENGFVCAPDARDIGACLSLLISQPQKACAMGDRGRLIAQRVQWRHVARRLLAALDSSGTSPGGADHADPRA